MNKALDASDIDLRVAEYLKARLAETADSLINQR
jgi:hypothetical protein